jgi:RhtB (resistance to homoserine/threonine) family protein
MGAHLLAFLGVVIVIAVVPGPDTALVTKNALLHGRRAALGTALGVNAGLVVWTVASAFGAATVVRASAVAFTVLKIAGAAYLTFLGVQALLESRRRSREAPAYAQTAPLRNPMNTRKGFRQGVLSNLANPKIAVFFTSLLPQFISRGEPVLAQFLILGWLMVLVGIVWLTGYALVAAKASGLLQRPRVKAALDRLTGVVLIGLGIRVATEHR